MATVAEIVTRLERRVIDLPTSVQAESQRLIEEAHRELQSVHNFKTMEALASVTTTASDPSLGAIGLENFKDYRGDPYWTDDLGVTRFLKVTHSEAEVRAGFNQDTTLGIGPPRVLLHTAPTAPGDAIEDHIWRVYPVPDGLALTSDGEYPITVPYWSWLAAPTTSDWFTNNAEPFILNAATAASFALNWDEPRYSFWRLRAYGPQWDARGLMGGDLLRAVQTDKRFKFSGVSTLVPYTGARHGRVRL